MTENKEGQKEFILWLKYWWHRKKNFRLGMERFLAGSSYHQIIAAIGVFAIVFFFVSGISYKWQWYKAFSDMSSPVTLRNTAYNVNNVVNGSTGTTYVTIEEPDSEKTLGLAIVYVLGLIVLSGLVIATITNVLRTWVDRFKQGTVRYCLFRRHIVILGYNDMVPGMIERTCGKNRRYPDGVRIVVGVRKDVHEVATQLSNHLSKHQRKCVVVLQADSCNKHDLKRLRARMAKEVYILGEHDDAYSLNSFEKIQGMCKGKQHPECYVQMQYQSTFALFQTYSGKDGMEHFHAFNFHDVWAREMLMREEIDTREGKSVGPDSEKQVHLVVIGMTEMGEALAREAAFLCHYPNYVSKGIRTRITFIDPQAKEQMTFLTGRYDHLFDLCRYGYRDFDTGDCTYHTPERDFLDMEFEFIQSNIASKAIRKEMSQWATSDKQVLTIAVCTEMPHRSIAAGLYLPDEVFDNNIPIWVYQPAKGDLKEFLDKSQFENVTTFGMSGNSLDIKNEADNLLQKAKRLNHFYWHFDGKKLTYDIVDVEKEWQSLTIFNKWSNLYNVSAIPTKLRCSPTQTEEDIEIISQVEHNRWNVEKLLMGFRPTTAEEHEEINPNGVRDQAKKRWYQNEKFAHDDIRPFNELDKDTADIDRKFTREIPKIMGL